MKVIDMFFNIVGKENNILNQFGVRKLGIFGSCARGEESKDSDIDVLVEFDEKTFDNYMGLKLFLEEKLGRKIDLVIIDALKPALREEVLREVKYAA